MSHRKHEEHHTRTGRSACARCNGEDTEITLSLSAQDHPEPAALTGDRFGGPPQIVVAKLAAFMNEVDLHHIVKFSRQS